MNSREFAFDALFAVEDRGAFLNLVVPKMISSSSLSKQDSAFATELCYGTSRNQGFYDWVISEVSARRTSELDLKTLVVLRLGAHQLLTLGTAAHAAIFETVELAKKRVGKSAIGFINAGLRRISETSMVGWIERLSQEDLSQDEFLSIRYSHPLWIVRALRIALRSEGAESQLEQALLANNKNPEVNLALLPGRDLEPDSRLEREGISPIGFVLESGDPSLVPGVMSGKLRIQDQGSQIAALALVHGSTVSAGESWLDLCAGPGGKASLLAASGASFGASLTTNEPSAHRAELVSTALRHSGLSATQLQLDGRDLPDGLMFDRIMLDAPCTGLGALRRRPESRWKKSTDQLKELSELQRDLLKSAWVHLKPDGLLAYVTCSPHPTETTSQIEWFLRQQNDALLVDAGEVVRRISPRIDMVYTRKTVQLWPHRNQSDAMFISLIKKQPS